MKKLASLLTNLRPPMENSSMEWNMEWKIFSMEWKKIASMEYGKIIFYSIPYHALIFTPLVLQFSFPIL